jgi:predicted ester cyclase
MRNRAPSAPTTAGVSAVCSKSALSRDAADLGGPTSGTWTRPLACTPVDTVEDNKALVERLVRLVNDGDLDALPEVADGEIAEAARRWIGPFRDAFPDFRMELVEAVAEPGTVVGYFKCSGTHRGEWRGIAPTGRRFEDIDEIYIFRVRDGKLAAAVVAVEDDLTRMRQLGLQP